MRKATARTAPWNKQVQPSCRGASSGIVMHHYVLLICSVPVPMVRTYSGTLVTV